MTDFVTINRKSVPIASLTGKAHLDFNKHNNTATLHFHTDDKYGHEYVSFDNQDNAISVYDQLMALLKKQGHTYLELK